MNILKSNNNITNMISRFLFHVITIGILFIFQTASAACIDNRTYLLSLSPNDFDEAAEGWRKLSKETGCLKEAADLIAEFRHSHFATLTESEMHLNYLHEGQLRAAGGDYTAARPLLMNGAPSSDYADFTDYALGTIAFLDNDKTALVSAIRRLEAQPEPDWFRNYKAEHANDVGGSPVWPPNLEVLKTLLTCFGKPYSVAYGGGCKSVGR